MLGKGSIFDELLKISENSSEKNLIKALFESVRYFYYILDIHDECNTNLKLFNCLFSDLETYTLEDIADKVFVSDRTVKRFKKKTERIVVTLITANKQFQVIKHILEKYKISSLSRTNAVLDNHKKCL